MVVSYLLSALLSRIIFGLPEPFWWLMLRSYSHRWPVFCLVMAVGMIVPWLGALLNTAEKLTERFKPSLNLKMTSKIESLLSLLLGIVLFSALIIGGRSLFSGYHFQDDHEILRFSIALRDTPFLTLASDIIRSDLNTRYRPLYSFTRVLKAYLFGPSYGVLMFITMIEGILTFWLLSRAFRHSGTSFSLSALLSGLVLFGWQFQPWFRFMNQENEGMLLSAVIFWMISYGYSTVRGRTLLKTWAYRLLMIIALVLSSLQKESFLIIIPGWLLLILWFALKEGYSGNVINMVKAHLWIIIPSLSALVFGILIILTHSGTKSMGYAQVSIDIPISRYLSGFSACWHGDAWPVNRLILIGSLLLTLALFYGDRQKMKSRVRHNAILFCAALYIMFTQLVLHAYSGMMERYILPYSLGVALLVPVICALLDNNSFLSALWGLSIIFTVYIGILNSYDMTDFFRIKGNNQNLLLSALKEELEDKKTDQTVLLDVVLEDTTAILAWFDYYAPATQDQIKWIPFRDGYGVQDESILKKTPADHYDMIITSQQQLQRGEKSYWVQEQHLDLNSYDVLTPGDEYGYALLIRSGP